MGMREDIMAVKKDLEEVKNESFASEILRDYKKTNKRQFIITIIILVMWFLTIGYLVYLLNDIGTIETSQTIEDIDSIDNSNIINNGDLYGEDKTNN